MKKKKKWHWIPGCEGRYKINREGDVRSISRTEQDKNGRTLSIEGGVVRQHLIDGYLYVTLSKRGVKREFPTHALVLLTFKGKRPKGMKRLHRNDDCTDNRLANLYYGSTRTTRSAEPEQDPQSDLGKEDASQALSLYHRGEVTSCQALADRFDVPYRTMYEVLTGITWKTLDIKGNTLSKRQLRKKRFLTI